VKELLLFEEAKEPYSPAKSPSVASPLTKAAVKAKATRPTNTILFIMNIYLFEENNKNIKNKKNFK